MTVTRYPAVGSAGALDDLSDVIVSGSGRGQIIAHNGTVFRNRNGAAFDVRDYGAVGNGVADDTVAIQAAIDAAESVRGVCLFPPGEYKISAALVCDTQGTTLRGSGRTGTLSSAAIGTAIKQVTANTDGLRIRADAITVEDIQINGTDAGTGRGLVIDDGIGAPPTQSRVTIRRVWVRDFGGDGVVALKPEQLTLDSVWSTSNGGKGFLIDSVGGSNPTNPYLVNCRAQSNLGVHQIHVKDAHYPVLLNCQALSGIPGNANLRLQNISGVVVQGGDYESGGASGIQISGAAGSIQNALFVSVATGVNCTTWTDGTISHCRFPSTITTSIAVDAGSRVAIFANQDASTNKVSWASAATAPTLRAAINDVGGQVFNVKAWGAKGDGTTDDTAAIQAAITAAGAGTVLFPAGTYLVTKATTFTAVLSVATAKARLRGEGDATIKASAAAATGLRLVAVTANDVTIEGLAFDGNAVSQATGIYASACSRLSVRGCRFNTVLSGGVHLADAVFDARIVDNAFSGNGYGVLTADVTTGGRWTIANNVFVGAGTGDRDAIEINTPTTGVSDLSITGNVIDNYQGSSQNVGFGIGMSHVLNITVSGNRVSRCSRNGIHMDGNCRAVTVSGNTVSDCGNGGIEVQTGLGLIPEGITLTGNTVEGCCLASPLVSPVLGYGGIEVGRAGESKGVVIVGNTCVGNGRAGIFGYELRNALITGNLCKNNGTVSGSAGIDVTTVHDGTITGNRCYDDQTVKTQTYGFKSFGGGPGCIITANSFSGNLTGAVSNGFSTEAIWGENSGYSPGGILHRLEGWVSDDNQNPSLGVIPADAWILGGRLVVTEAFNSDGTDQISAGLDANTQGIFTLTDVSTTGIKTVTLGGNATYNSVPRSIEAYYVNGGSEPTTGKALVVVEYYLVTTQVA